MIVKTPRFSIPAHIERSVGLPQHVELSGPSCCEKELKLTVQARSEKMRTILRGLALLLLSYLMEAKQQDFYTFKLVNSRGKLVSLEKYRGSVSLG